MTDKEFSDDCVRMASCYFLYKELPNDHDIWTDEDTHAYCEEYALADYEYKAGDEIYGYILDLADSFESMTKNRINNKRLKFKEVTENE